MIYEYKVDQSRSTEAYYDFCDLKVRWKYKAFSHGDFNATEKKNRNDEHLRDSDVVFISPPPSRLLLQNN